MKTINNMKAMKINEEMLEQVNGGAPQEDPCNNSSEDGLGFFDWFRDLFHISRRGLMTFDPIEADRPILDRRIDIDNVRPFNQVQTF